MSDRVVYPSGYYNSHPCHPLLSNIFMPDITVTKARGLVMTIERGYKPVVDLNNNFVGLAASESGATNIYVRDFNSMLSEDEPYGPIRQRDVHVREYGAGWMCGLSHDDIYSEQLAA